MEADVEAISPVVHSTSDGTADGMTTSCERDTPASSAVGRAFPFLYHSACDAAYEEQLSDLLNRAVASSNPMARGSSPWAEVIATGIVGSIAKSTSGPDGAGGSTKKAPPTVLPGGAPGKPGNLLTGLAKLAGVSPEYVGRFFPILQNVLRSGFNPRRDPAEVAKVVVESESTSYPKIEKQHGVGHKTIQKWRSVGGLEKKRKQGMHLPAGPQQADEAELRARSSWYQPPKQPR